MLIGSVAECLRKRREVSLWSGTDNAGNLLAVADEDEGGPQLDSERATQRKSFAIGNTDVLHSGMRWQPSISVTVDALAVWTPVRTEVEKNEAGRLINLLTGDALRLIWFATFQGHGEAEDKEQKLSIERRALPTWMSYIFVNYPRFLAHWRHLTHNCGSIHLGSNHTSKSLGIRISALENTVQSQQRMH